MSLLTTLLEGVPPVADFEVFTGSFAANTSTGDQVVSGGYGFTGKLVVFAVNSCTAADTAVETNRLSFGAADGTNQRVAYVAADDAADPMNCGRGSRNNACISLPATGTPTDDGVAAFVSFGVGEFTINWSDAPASAVLVEYTVYGGDAFQAKVGNYTTLAATGNQSVTDPGFPGNVVLQWTTGQTSYTTATHYRFNIGCATGAAAEWTVGLAGEDAATTSNVVRDNRDDACLTVINHAGVDGVADFTQFTATGWDQNWSDGPAAGVIVNYIYMSVPHAKAGVYAQRTSDGTSQVTGVGYLPQGLLQAAISDTDTGFESNSARITLGMCDAELHQVSVANVSVDNAGAAVEFQVVDLDKGYVSLTTAGAIATLHVDSLDADGWTYTSVGTTTAILNRYLALAGDDAQAGGAYTHYRELAATGAG